MSKRNSARRLDAPYKSKNQSAAEAYAQRARQHYQENQPKRAIKLLEQAIALAPRNAKLHQELGRWLVAGKQTAEGISHLEESLEINGDFVPALIELGQEHVKKNAFEKAQPLLENALTLSAENPAAHIVYGTFLQKQGQLPGAVDHFRNALHFRLSHPPKPVQPPKKNEDFDKSETEELMWHTLSVLARAGVHAFASYGTLLGLIREGGLLPFDKDIDFGLPHCEMERASQCLESNGWIENKNSFLTNPRAFVHPLKGVSLDLSGFVVDSTTGETFTGFWIDNVPTEWQRHTRYIDIRLQKDTSPAGEPIWSLQDPEAWLETIYGAWQVPDPNFDTVIAAKNLCQFSLLTQSYAFSRIYEKWEKGLIRKAVALVEHTRRHLPDDLLIQKVEAYLKTILPKDKREEPTVERSSSKPNSPVALDEIDENFGARYDDNTNRLNFNS